MVYPHDKPGYWRRTYEEPLIANHERGGETYRISRIWIGRGEPSGSPDTAGYQYRVYRGGERIARRDSLALAFQAIEEMHRHYVTATA